MTGFFALLKEWVCQERTYEKVAVVFTPAADILRPNVTI